MPVIPASPVAANGAVDLITLQLLREILSELRMIRFILTAGFRAELGNYSVSPEDAS